MKKSFILSIIIILNFSLTAESKLKIIGTINYTGTMRLSEILEKNRLSGIMSQCRRNSCYSTSFKYAYMKEKGYWEADSGSLVQVDDKYQGTHLLLMCDKCGSKYLIQYAQVYYEQGKTKYIEVGSPRLFSE